MAGFCSSLKRSAFSFPTQTSGSPTLLQGKQLEQLRFRRENPSHYDAYLTVTGATPDGRHALMPTSTPHSLLKNHHRGDPTYHIPLKLAGVKNFLFLILHHCCIKIIMSSKVCLSTYPSPCPVYLSRLLLELSILFLFQSFFFLILGVNVWSLFGVFQLLFFSTQNHLPSLVLVQVSLVSQTSLKRISGQGQVFTMPTDFSQCSSLVILQWHTDVFSSNLQSLLF